MWDQECNEVIKQRKRALQEFRKTKTVLSFIEYKKRRAMAIKVINTKKREIFDQFCSTINRFTNLIYVWNMRIFQNMRKNINWNTWAQKNRDEEIKKEIDKLAPSSVPIGPRNIQRIDTELTAMEKDFNIEELIRVIDMIRRNSAPGRDGIEYRMIKELSEIMKKELLRLYNEIWRSNTLLKD